MTVNTNLGGGQLIMDFAHYKVHDGQLFSASFYNTIGAAANQDIMIVTGTKKEHVVMQVAVTGQALLSIYEGITSSANGTTITVYNMNRNSSDSCASVFFSGPTWSTNSEKLIFRQIVPGGALATSRVGGQSRSGAEWNFLPTTKYLIRITDQSGATNTATWNTEFYEV